MSNEKISAMPSASPLAGTDIFPVVRSGNYSAELNDLQTFLQSNSGGLFTFAFRNITVLTTGADADVATLVLPNWLTRFMSGINTWGNVVAETAAGTLASAGYSIYTGPGATGILFSGSALPASIGVATVMTNGFVTHIATGSPITLYLRQIGNSANAGVVSSFWQIRPMV